MTLLVFQKRNNINKVESRHLAEKLGITNHKKWLANTILGNEDLIIQATGIVVEIDYVKNTKGAKTKIAWFTEDQAYFVITLTKHTEKGLEAKAALAQTMRQMNQINKESSRTENKWTEFKASIIPAHEASKLQTYFSPDLVFAEFLEKLERDCGYSLPKNWDIKPPHSEGVDTMFYSTPEQDKILRFYNKMAQDEDIPDLFTAYGMPLPPQDNAYHPDKNPCAIVNLHRDTEQNAFDKWVKAAEALVECYKSNALRAKYNLISIEEEKENGTPLAEKECPLMQPLLDAERNLTQLINQVKPFGFKVHKDWLDWLKSEDITASKARALYCGTEWTIDFSVRRLQDATTVIQFDEHDDCFEEATVKPLIKNLRLYLKKYFLLFEWYLTNVWLPQHSVKFFQVTDPEGFPQLCQAMRSLPSSHNLPRQFVEAMQPLLAAAQ